MSANDHPDHEHGKDPLQSKSHEHNKEHHEHKEKEKEKEKHSSSQTSQASQASTYSKNGGLAKSVGEFMDSKELTTLNPDKITRIYKVPSPRFKTAQDIVAYYGYTLADKFAEGGFGVVYTAVHNKTGIKVACKQVDLGKSKRPDSSRMVDMKNELFILGKLHNPYIVKLYAHFVANNQLYIFLKLANGGNFQKFVKEKGVLTERESQVFFGQILCGVEFMHSLAIAHRDIKLDNILLLKHPNKKLTVLVTDFGLSRCISFTETNEIVLSKTICGTPGYMSPELLQLKPFNAFQADVWALGVMLYAMLNSVLPFADDQKEMLEQQLNKDWKLSENIAEDPTENLVNLLKVMMEPDPEKRITLTDMLAHPWIHKQYNYAKNYFQPKQHKKKE